MEEKPEEPRRSGPRLVDLNKAANDERFKIEIKSHDSAEELQSRLRREEADAVFERWKDLIRFSSVSLLVASAAATCLWVLLRPGRSAEDQKWAVPMLTTVLSGAVGYAFGKASK